MSEAYHMAMRRALLLAWLALAIVALSRAAPEVRYMARAFLADGPNTVGEAGKVWFAHRVQNGQPAFSGGDEPPYYPSVHGALLHASIGVVGRVIEASLTDLYAVGRWMSVLTTGLAWLALGALALRLGVRGWAIALGFVLWIGTFPLVEHTISYRPDNWVLALSALACWLLAARPDRPWALVTLVLLPGVAFHVKVTGLLIVASVGLVHLVRRQWRRAVMVGVAQVAIVGLSLLALDRAAGGEYLRGLGGAVDVPWDASYLLLPHLLELGDPVIPLLLLGPIPLLAWLTRGRAAPGSRDTALVVGCFWAATLAGYGMATIRAGSAPYYLLEPASFGLLLVLSAAQLVIASPRLDRFPSLRPSSVLTLTALLAGPVLVSTNRDGTPDVSLLRTELVGPSRETLAARVNAQDGMCYSDDPGLNVLLDRPAVIYPLLQHQMIQSGALSRATLFDPVERHEYRCVIFAGVDWSYRGAPVVPADFRALVAREYPWIEGMGRYRIHYRDRDPLPVLGGG